MQPKVDLVPQGRWRQTVRGFDVRCTACGRDILRRNPTEVPGDHQHGRVMRAAAWPPTAGGRCSQPAANAPCSAVLPFWATTVLPNPSRCDIRLCDDSTSASKLRAKGFVNIDYVNTPGPRSFDDSLSGLANAVRHARFYRAARRVGIRCDSVFTRSARLSHQHFRVSQTRDGNWDNPNS